MAEAEEDFSSLPLPDRFQHKIWKVRKGGYEDAAKQFEVTPDEHDPVFRPFLLDSGLWKGAVADSNVAAQQDGIAAYCAFLKYGGREGATRTRGHTITPLTEKGLSSTRAATKTSSLEAILLLIELDIAAPVIEEILPAASNKQPKVVAATLAALTAIYHNYGCKTVDPKPVLKILPKAFGHADKNVRAEATNLAVEFYRWLREAMKPMFWNDLKPTQQTDLEAQFEKIKAEPTPRQERFLRSQQAAIARAPAAAAGELEDEDEGEAEAAEVDTFDLAEPQDVLSKVPADFHENLASSKWKERKEALEALYAVINVPRIKDGDFGEVARGLAKSMKDANIAVVTTAAQCIEVLGKGLRKPFGRYRSTLMGPVLERLKEKKASVSDALGLGLDQIFAATGLSDCLEEILEFLKHKNPQVKEGTMKFLIRCLKTTREAPSKPEVTSICEAGKKLLAESSEVLRSGGAEVLGTIMKIMGERAMGPHLEGLDDIRKTKIKEYFDVAVVKAKDKPKPVAVAAPPKAAPATTTRKVVKKAAPKKAAPAPSPYAQQAPLEPQPTARSVPGSKLGAPKPSGLAAPGGFKAPIKRQLAGPGGAAPPAIASPRRPPARAPTPEEAAPPAPRIGPGGRGLAGRPLGKPSAPVQLYSPEPVDSSLSAVEKAELEELRLDKDRLLRQCDDLRQERSRLHSEVQELKNQNAQLIEDHTRDILSIKAKETQLVRARSDAEAAEAMCAQMRREMDRLKRALTSAEKANDANRALASPAHDKDISGGNDDNGIYRDSGMHGAGAQEGRRTPGLASYGQRNMSFTSQLSEEKENGVDGSMLARSKLRSPDLYGRERDASAGSNGRGSPARQLYRNEKRDIGIAGASAEAPQGVESWKRAAEVTSALKAKIEQMKVCCFETTMCTKAFSLTTNFGFRRGKDFQDLETVKQSDTNFNEMSTTMGICM
ncbi:MAG: Microtubule-associated protein, microtubule dynamics during spindle orientation [Claussenomyces sp. TS43310]|nr:MAG: Microtubule-associated protein, microtubule dynamics during spindle orientation [Claussenomyces sp. TS43310]